VGGLIETISLPLGNRSVVLIHPTTARDVSSTVVASFWAQFCTSCATTAGAHEISATKCKLTSPVEDGGLGNQNHAPVTQRQRNWSLSAHPPTALGFT